MINNSNGSVCAASSGTFKTCSNSKIQLTPNVPTEVLPANPKRAYAAFINNSQEDITLVMGDKSKAVINEGIIIKGHGGSFEITFFNLYIGKVSAISPGAVQLSFVEGFE